MKNIRLNERLRREILGRLTRHAFLAAQGAISRSQAELAAEVYDDLYPADVQRKMRRLPASFFETKTQVCVGMGGQRVSIDVPDKPVAFAHHYFSEPAKSYPADHRFTLRHNDLYSRKQRLDEEISRARHAGRSVLQSCTSCRQLVEVWPEAEPFVRDFAASPSPLSVALVVPVAELNRQFGLGVESPHKTSREKGKP